MSLFDLIVIGGGAAGFYGAIQAAQHRPGLSVLILEKSQRVLSKVKISGGGRCNVTHRCFDPVAFSRHYPRGEKPLRTVFRHHGASETVDWFSRQAVALKAEADGRMFPVTDDSQTIIDCLLTAAGNCGIELRTGHAVERIVITGDHFDVVTGTGTFRCKKVLIATGGSPKPEAYAFLRALGHSIRGPIPSLFTFNDPARRFADLMGVSVANADVRIAGTKFRQSGPLLITHWGLSGPAIIRLSAWAAEYLHDVNYSFTVLVSWVGPVREEQFRETLHGFRSTRAKQRVVGHPLFDVPQRLWTRLCSLADIPEHKVWAELSHKHLNRLLEHLSKCIVDIRGKTTFKEEFVTCGGVDLAEVDLSTMESRKVKGVFFAGEVLDVDGETGGFNFQAAWSTAFLAARSIAGK